MQIEVITRGERRRRWSLDRPLLWAGLSDMAIPLADFDIALHAERV